MSVKSKELRENRAKLVPQMRTLADRQKEWTAEDRTAWEAINKQYDDLTAEITREEDAEKVASRLAAVEDEQRSAAPPPNQRTGRENADGRQESRDRRPTEEDRCLAFAGWCRRQMDLDVDERQQEAASRVGMRLDSKALSIDLPDSRYANQLANVYRSNHPTMVQRALSAVQGPAGAFTVPESFITSLEVAMLAWGGMRQVSEILRTTGGEEMSWPTADDSSAEGRQIGESEAVDTTGANIAEPTFGRTIWRAYKFTSDAVLVPNELLEDSAFDVASVLGGMLGERLGRIQNRRCTTGTGAAQPRGIVPASTLGVTTAAAAAITTDEIIQLEHSVDPAYRIGASYMFHDNVLMALRLLKDGEGRYLWQSNVQAGAPDRINGRPYTINQHMASTVQANAITALFGQLNKYKIREVRGIRLYRLEERYRDNDQDGFVAFVRFDGNLLDAGGHPVRHLLQHA